MRSLSRRFLIAGGACRLFATGPAYSSRTIDLVRGSTVIDMLGLITLNYRRLAAWQNKDAEFPLREFERLKRSGVTVVHPAVGFLRGDVRGSSWGDIMRWNFFLTTHPDKFLRVDKPADIDFAKASGKIGVILGLQNSAHFRTIEDVNLFYVTGQRVSQLTYYNNPIGGGSTDPGCGLSAYGAQVVERMNRLGMAIDVSHCGDRTTLDAIAASRKPVLVTHSNCRALVPNSVRCKTDEAIRRMAAKGGVMGVTLVRGLVRSNGPATMEHVLQHIDHIVSVAGVAHVGLGTDVDLDGRGEKQDLEGSSYSDKIYQVTEGLIRRKYSPAHIEAILGGNFRRALGQIWGA